MHLELRSRMKRSYVSGVSPTPRKAETKSNMIYLLAFASSHKFFEASEGT